MRRPSPNRLHRNLLHLGVAAYTGWAAACSCAADQATMTSIAQTEYESISATRPWNVYVDRFTTTGTDGIPQYDARHLAWGEAIHGQTRLSRFEADGHLLDLEYILDQIELVNAHRADRVTPPLNGEQRDSVPPAWISFNLSQGADAKQHAWLGHVGRAIYPAARIAAFVKNDSHLNATYGLRIDAILSDIVQSLDMFESEYHVDSDGAGIYRDPYFEFYSGKTVLPFNLQTSAGRAFIALSEATGDPRFRQRAYKLAIGMKNELTAIDDRYQWRYATYRQPTEGEDVSHAAINVNFMIDAYEAGLVFDDTDIRRLTNTMKHLYTPDDGFTYRVDGLGEVNAGTSDNMAAWLRLTNYDASLRELVFPYFLDQWANQRSNVNSLIGSAFYIESGKPFEARKAVIDSFDERQLDRRWIRSEGQPLDTRWQTETANGQFIVSDISGGTPDAWTSITRHQNVQTDTQDPSWEARIDFSWSTIEVDQQHAAMQRFFLNTYDTDDNRTVRVGLDHSRQEGPGELTVQVGNGGPAERVDSLDSTGQTSVRVVSDPVRNLTAVEWNGEWIYVGNAIADPAAIEVEFGHFVSEFSSFGSVALEEFYFGPIIGVRRGGLPTGAELSLEPIILTVQSANALSQVITPEPTGGGWMIWALMLSGSIARLGSHRNRHRL